MGKKHRNLKIVTRHYVQTREGVDFERPFEWIGEEKNGFYPAIAAGERDFYVLSSSGEVEFMLNHRDFECDANERTLVVTPRYIIVNTHYLANSQRQKSVLFYDRIEHKRVAIAAGTLAAVTATPSEDGFVAIPKSRDGLYALFSIEQDRFLTDYRYLGGFRFFAGNDFAVVAVHDKYTHANGGRSYDYRLISKRGIEVTMPCKKPYREIDEAAFPAGNISDIVAVMPDDMYSLKIERTMHVPGVVSVGLQLKMLDASILYRTNYDPWTETRTHDWDEEAPWRCMDLHGRRIPMSAEAVQYCNSHGMRMEVE